MARKMDEEEAQEYRDFVGYRAWEGDDAQPHRGRNLFLGRLDSLQETAQTVQV